MTAKLNMLDQFQGQTDLPDPGEVGCRYSRNVVYGPGGTWMQARAGTELLTVAGALVTEGGQGQDAVYEIKDDRFASVVMAVVSPNSAGGGSGFVSSLLYLTIPTVSQQGVYQTAAADEDDGVILSPPNFQNPSYAWAFNYYDTSATAFLAAPATLERVLNGEVYSYEQSTGSVQGFLPPNDGTIDFTWVYNSLYIPLCGTRTGALAALALYETDDDFTSNFSLTQYFAILPVSADQETIRSSASALEIDCEVSMNAAWIANGDTRRNVDEGEYQYRTSAQFYLPGNGAGGYNTGSTQRYVIGATRDQFNTYYGQTTPGFPLSGLFLTSPGDKTTYTKYTSYTKIVDESFDTSTTTDVYDSGRADLYYNSTLGGNQWRLFSVASSPLKKVHTDVAYTTDSTTYEWQGTDVAFTANTTSTTWNNWQFYPAASPTINNVFVLANTGSAQPNLIILRDASDITTALDFDPVISAVNVGLSGITFGTSSGEYAHFQGLGFTKTGKLVCLCLLNDAGTWRYYIALLEAVSAGSTEYQIMQGWPKSLGKVAATPTVHKSGALQLGPKDAYHYFYLEVSTSMPLEYGIYRIPVNDDSIGTLEQVVDMTEIVTSEPTDVAFAVAGNGDILISCDTQFIYWQESTDTTSEVRYVDDPDNVTNNFLANNVATNNCRPAVWLSRGWTDSGFEVEYFCTLGYKDPYTPEEPAVNFHPVGTLPDENDYVQWNLAVDETTPDDGDGYTLQRNTTYNSDIHGVGLAYVRRILAAPDAFPFS